MKTEISSTAHVAQISQFASLNLPDNYRLITGYPSDNSQPKTDTNKFTINSKDNMNTDNRQKISVATLHPQPNPNSSGQRKAPSYLVVAGFAADATMAPG
jgi:hypothetical protein